MSLFEKTGFKDQMHRFKDFLVCHGRLFLSYRVSGLQYKFNPNRHAVLSSFLTKVPLSCGPGVLILSGNMTSGAKNEKIIIIDGSGYIFRAYYAIQRLSTSQGFPTNAIFGFVNMLMRVLEVEKPRKLVIVFDTPKPTFRKEIFPEYKANRSAPPEDWWRKFRTSKRRWTVRDPANAKGGI